MTRSQRRAHVWLWAFISLLMGAVIAGALFERARLEAAFSQIRLEEQR